MTLFVSVKEKRVHDELDTRNLHSYKLIIIVTVLPVRHASDLYERYPIVSATITLAKNNLSTVPLLLHAM